MTVKEFFETKIQGIEIVYVYYQNKEICHYTVDPWGTNWIQQFNAQVDHSLDNKTISYITFDFGSYEADINIWVE